ncbi:pilus assembly protein TadG-related protein [Halomonas sp. SpR8]|uniref:pilus assembly protein TadG-related protein n=1 Tax=Halomonas sp. SpR8 TaxID=3050463 RepID=UPI0027E409B1|nr:pilus assembly protein TadG-related protein [Halomonas sp. SpR8]MDQ7728169.1 pilus assembly protein TadG-related protein [Halomonas sp. SpR8]
MPPIPYGPIGPARQQGVISILTAFLLVMLLTVLALVVDTGRLYLEQRNLQKIADMAALDASARLPKGYCAGEFALAQQFALESAALHGFTPGEETTLTTQCVTLASQDGMRQVTPNASNGAGVQVIAAQETPASLLLRGGALFSDAFSGTISLSANASAQRSDAIAAFTVGSQLLRLNSDKLLGQLLEGVGLDVSLLTVLDANGIANASVTPAGLLRELGIDVGIDELALLSPSGLIDLVDTQIGLLGIDELINASAALLGDNALSASLSALETEILSNTILESADLKLLGSDGEGLIQLALGSLNSTRAALEGDINLGELLSVALLTGTSQHAVNLESLNLLGIDVSASITEPPALAVGPVGVTAYTGQVRLHLDIDTDNIPVLGFLTSLLGTRVHLPLTLDVSSAKGELTGLQCQTDTPTADIEVTSSILNACVGDIDEDDLWSGTDSCSAYVQETELIKLLGAPVLSGKSIIPGITHQETLTGMEVDETRSTQPSSLQLGNTVNNLVESLLDLLGGLFRPPQRDHGGNLASEAPQSQDLAEDLAKQYLESSADSDGRYNVDRVISFISNGSSEPDKEPLAALGNWYIPNSIPKSCGILGIGLTICPQNQWNHGNFSEAFRAYMSPPAALLGILDLLGISTLGEYRACNSHLLGLTRNQCMEHNLTRLLLKNPGGLPIGNPQDGNSVTNPATDTVNCSGVLCLLLRPLLNIVKPILNAVGNLVTTLLADSLGLELGRTDVRVESISCGVPTLVQ